MIEVGDGHILYSQLWGNLKSGKKIVFLHGGPGSGLSSSQKQLFDPKDQLVLFFDQRGSGKSLPYGELENNDTAKLAEDINTLTKHYRLNKFYIVGGSWGSCLALVYAIKNPNRVQGLILRGIFTGRSSEADYMDDGTIRTFYPDVWQTFIETVPAKDRVNPRKYHMKALFGKDKQAAIKSAIAYSTLEGSLISLDDRTRSLDSSTFDPVPVTIECHYIDNNCFLEENYILDHAKNLNLPVVIIQGRYDAVCPPVTAYELNQQLPNSQLYFTIAGHSGSDRANVDLTRVVIKNI